MKIYLDGYDYRIEDLSRSDVKSLLTMIKGAGLCERRVFDNLKQQIEMLEKNDLL